MRVTDRRRLGRTAVELTVLGFGGSQVGNLHRPVPEDDAAQAIATAWKHGIRYFDTAPLYSRGLGEHRLGRALRNHLRDAYVLSTKVGRLVTADGIEYDYSYDGVLRSIGQSVERLGLARIDVALIHDIDLYTHGLQGQRRRFREAMNAKMRQAFTRWVELAAERGWAEYRAPAVFQDAVAKTYSFNDGALNRMRETIKDALDPNGILSPGRYGVWPKHLRKS